MLDYYDRCYDHELSRRNTPVRACFDLTGMDPVAAASLLLQHPSSRLAAVEDDSRSDS
jgi:hypothetical protein